MLKAGVMAFLFVFVAVAVFSFISEVTYKKRNPSAVFGDYKRILLRSLILSIVVFVTTFIYTYWKRAGG